MRILLILMLLLNGCAITPHLTITESVKLDVRHDGHHKVKQGYFQPVPHYGEYYICIGFNYNYEIK